MSMDLAGIAELVTVLVVGGGIVVLILKTIRDGKTIISLIPPLVTAIQAFIAVVVAAIADGTITSEESMDLLNRANAALAAATALWKAGQVFAEDIRILITQFGLLEAEFNAIKLKHTKVKP